MAKIDEIIEEDIDAKLSTLKIANGYTADVSILDGYMVHYASDLSKNKNNLSFPCVAIQPAQDEFETNSSSTKSKVKHHLLLVGAVSSSERNLIRQRLNELVLDVRKALAINTITNKSKANSIDFGGAKFALPEKHERYAYFEMSITINYVEQLIQC